MLDLCVIRNLCMFQDVLTKCNTHMLFPDVALSTHKIKGLGADADIAYEFLCNSASVESMHVRFVS